MRKIHEAKESMQDHVEVWGSGRPKREFLHVDDCADAAIFLAKNYSDAMHVNIGSGTDVTIRDLAQTIAKIVGFEGDFVFNSAYPDGVDRKLLDVSRATKLGWRSTKELSEGLRQTYEWYVNSIE